MVPNDLRKSNLTVDDILLVRGKVVTPEIRVARLFVTDEASIPNIMPDDGSGGGGTLPTNIVLTTGDQTINGIKTFTSAPGLSGLSLLFSSLFLTNTSNQLTLGTGTTATLNAVTPSSSRVYSIQDTGADANIVMSEGTQSINGTTTFGTGLLLPTLDGVPALLNYYEEFMGAYDFTSNAFSGTRTVAYQIIRIGSQVTLFLTDMPASTASGSPGVMIANTTPIPDRFQYQNTGFARLHTFASIISNSSPAVGTVTLTSGNCIVSAGAGEGSQFAATGLNGFSAFSVTWTLPGPP